MQTLARFIRGNLSPCALENRGGICGAALLFTIAKSSPPPVGAIFQGELPVAVVGEGVVGDDGVDARARLGALAQPVMQALALAILINLIVSALEDLVWIGGAAWPLAIAKRASPPVGGVDEVEVLVARIRGRGCGQERCRGEQEPGPGISLDVTVHDSPPQRPKDALSVQFLRDRSFTRPPTLEIRAPTYLHVSALFGSEAIPARTVFSGCGSCRWPKLDRGSWTHETPARR
jgi:hypothetical protein